MRPWLISLYFLNLIHAAEVTPDRIRSSAAKALAVIQQSQKNWYAKQSCNSCHQQYLPAMAFRAARDHGVPVDEVAARADAVQAFGFYSNLARAVEYTHVVDPAMNDAFGLLGADAAGVSPNLSTAVYARIIAARQEKDGRWVSVDERPPQSYSNFTATAIALRAIQLYGHPSQRKETRQRVEWALVWLLSHEPGCTEERVFQLRGAHWAGADSAALQKMATKLQATQRSDGGWNSAEGRESDAYSTGQVLAALHEAGGLASADPAYQRGVAWLLQHQEADGSWRVASRLHPPAQVSPPYFETGHPYGHDQFISVMGECYAVMALAAALGPGKPAPRKLTDVEPRNVETWMETLIFGSVGETRKVLDRGLNPNTRSRSGGLTPLMLAAPDVDKMKLLIDRGADVNLRADNHYSALLVAAQYSGSAAAMNLLLDRGATVRLPKGQGSPLFNAFPIFLAACAGNTEILPRLARAGDRVDDKMIVLGIAPVTATIFLAQTERVESIRALLDAGAKVEETDDDGVTLLGWAVIANRLETARLLIERGADVNHVDQNGMTPLLYAASIDFGDSKVIDLLLQSGARSNALTKEGLTALALARKYNHANLVQALEHPVALH
jgi:ankyrin repeat protein